VADGPVCRQVGQPRADALVAVDGGAHGSLGAEREELADERERGRAGDEHAHAAVALGAREVGGARDQRLGLRAVGDRSEDERVGRRDGGVGDLVAEPRPHVALDVERLRRDGGRDPVAQPRDGRERVREPREPPVLRAVGIRREVHVHERPRGHEPRRGVRRPAAGAARADEPGDERERGAERKPEPGAARPGARDRRGDACARHAARRRCLRSAKSMITGMPSSA
jgi:hypothetical protein